MELAPQEIRTFFVTAVTANRRRLFQVEANANLLLQLLRDDQAKGRYLVHAFVLMPDHIHLLLTPSANVSIEKAMQFIKGGFSFRLKSRMPVWEDSFTKRRIEDARFQRASRLHPRESRARASVRTSGSFSILVCARRFHRRSGSGASPSLKAPSFPAAQFHGLKAVASTVFLAGRSERRGAGTSGLRLYMTEPVVSCPSEFHFSPVNPLLSCNPSQQRTYNSR